MLNESKILQLRNDLLEEQGKRIEELKKYRLKFGDFGLAVVRSQIRTLNLVLGLPFNEGISEFWVFPFEERRRLSGSRHGAPDVIV